MAIPPFLPAFAAIVAVCLMMVAVSTYKRFNPSTAEEWDPTVPPVVKPLLWDLRVSTISEEKTTKWKEIMPIGVHSDADMENVGEQIPTLAQMWMGLFTQRVKEAEVLPQKTEIQLIVAITMPIPPEHKADIDATLEDYALGTCRAFCHLL